jgi:4-amino-4-deoxy-L-arabinose transferase-like glycosyltransferase
MRKHSWIIFWAAAVLLLFYLNGALPLTDSVEGNYALTAKEMVLSGDWLSPQIYGRYWFDKPVFAYWMIALGFKIFGFNEFGARFFPSLFGLAGLGLVVWGGRRLYSEKVGFYSGVLMLMTLQFFTISKSVLTDGMLFLFLNGALLFYYLGYSTREKRYYYVMYVCAALATLTKGPIGFLLPGLIFLLFLIWRRDFASLKKARLFSGIALFLLVAAPWYIAMAVRHPDFLSGFIGTQNFLRATVAEHPRDNVIWYYTAVNILNAFAWIGLVPGMLKRYLWKDGHFVRPGEKEGYLMLWVAVIFLFFQCMATKYITYTYPILLPLCVLTASYLVEEEEKVTLKWLLLGNILFYGALAVVAYQLPKLAPKLLQHPRNIFYFVSIFLACYLVLCFHRYRGKSSKEIFTMTILITYLFFFWSVKLLALPLMSGVTGKWVGMYINLMVPENIPIYVRGGGYPTSTWFYTGRKLTMLVPDDQAEEFAPKDYSWSAKNIMPWTTYSKVQDVPQAVVLVDTNTKKIKTKLQEDWPGVWQKLKFYGQWTMMIKHR